MSRSLHICSASGVNLVQSVTWPMTLSGALLRYDRVGFPGNFLSVTFGSFSNARVGSTM